MADLDIAGATDAVAAADATTTTRITMMLRGVNTATVGYIDADWELIDYYPKFVDKGIPLKGIVFIPGAGGANVFVVRDGENGAYIYNQSITAISVVNYPETFVKPFIDFSECTLRAGHLVTFVW
jgi:hypothetical protein